MARKQGTEDYIPLSQNEIYKIRMIIIGDLFDRYEKKKLEDKGYTKQDIISERGSYIELAINHTTIEDLLRHYDRKIKS